MGNPGLPVAQSRLGRYELLARLATGGMGEIFLARLEGAEGFEKLYVIKRVLPHLADDARFRQMLISEARIASKLSHANICQVYELGETDGQLYIVMEYLEGITLLPVLRRASKQNEPLDLGFVAGVLQQACDALHYAHELRDRGDSLGIVHRDVTPTNVFVTESGVIKLLDFGIAKAKGASTQTQEGTVKGKYAYMAPEQLRGGEIDRRVDLFALGIVVYEMLALRRLFQRKTDYLTFRAVMEQPVADIRRYRPDVPEALALVLARALDRDPANRFETARQLGTAILDALSPQRRPWSQGEISDFVREHFADDIGKRSQQVHHALGRTSPGAPIAQRTTMPLIAQPEDSHDDEGEDAEFPPVETDLDAAPPRPHDPTPRAASQPGDFIVGTPPPFGAESTGSAPSLQPIRPAPAAAPPRRSLLWPMIALGMLAVAGGALFLVWQQMQQRQTPTSVVITQSPDPRASEPVTPAPGSAAVAPSPGSAAPVARFPVPPPGQPPAHHGAKTDPYTAAVQARLGALNQCLVDHQGAAVPKSATIQIATTGKPKSVAITPASLASTPLGECLKNVLMDAAFPAAHDDRQITVPFFKT